MKSESAEMRRISRIVQRIAMSHPDIAFTLLSNGRKTLDLPQRSNARTRILDVMGSELDSQMLDLDVSREDVRLWGLVGLPEVARPTSQHQQIYLNGRAINDRSLSHAPSRGLSRDSSSRRDIPLRSSSYKWILQGWM